MPAWGGLGSEVKEGSFSFTCAFMFCYVRGANGEKATRSVRDPPGAARGYPRRAARRVDCPVHRSGPSTRRVSGESKPCPRPHGCGAVGRVTHKGTRFVLCARAVGHGYRPTTTALSDPPAPQRAHGLKRTSAVIGDGFHELYGVRPAGRACAVWVCAVAAPLSCARLPLLPSPPFCGRWRGVCCLRPAGPPAVFDAGIDRHLFFGVGHLVMNTAAARSWG